MKINKIRQYHQLHHLEHHLIHTHFLIYLPTCLLTYLAAFIPACLISIHHLLLPAPVIVHYPQTYPLLPQSTSTLSKCHSVDS